MCYFYKPGKKNKTMLCKNPPILAVPPAAVTSPSRYNLFICFFVFVFLNCNHVFPQPLLINAVTVFHVLLK